MKRHLKRFKQLLTLTMMVIGISQSIVTEAYSQTINNPVGVSCDCQDGLPEGWKVMNISFSGTSATNFVIGTSVDIFDTNQMALTSPFGFTETSTGVYEALVLADVTGTPAVGIGYLSGGVFIPSQNIVSFPASCSINSVELSPTSATACVSSMSTDFTAVIPEDPNGTSYEYTFSFSVNGAVVASSPMAGSGTASYSFPTGIATPTAGTYNVQVTAEQFDLGGATTGCTYSDMASITLYDLSSMISVIGDDEVCDTGTPQNYYLNIDEFSNGQTLDWAIMDGGAAPAVMFSSTGSGTSIDFAGYAIGDYTISVSGMTDDGCTFETTLPFSIVVPGGVISGPTETACGSTDTYTVLPEGGTTAGTTWTVVGGTITSSDDDTATVAWDMSTTGSLTAEGTTGDGCTYSLSTTVSFLSGASAVSIDGDTHVCDDEFGFYSLASTGVDLDDYTYAWALLDGTGADISANPCPLLSVTNSGQSQPMDFSCLTPGDYTLTVAASSTTGCPDFSLSTTITVADPSVINSIACVSGGLNVTIGNSCTLEVTADLLLQGAGSINNDAYEIQLVDVESGEMIVGNILDHSYINKEIEVKVIDQCSGNSCWGYITVEDKSIPALVCPADPITPLDCLDAADKTIAAYMPVFDPTVVVTYNGDNNWTLEGYDNCGDATLTCEDVDQTMGECANPRFITRVWTVTDEYGATSTCSIDLTVIYDENNLVTYPPNYDDVLPGAEPSIDVCSNYPTDEGGNPHPSMTGMPEASSCVELVVIGYTDTNLEICGGDSPARKVIREWVIWSPCANGGLGDDISYTQYITLTDTAPPICAAFDEFSVVTGSHDCGASIFVPQPEVSNECGTVYIDMTYKLRDDNGIIPALFSDEGVSYDPIAQGFTIDNVSFVSDSLWILFEVKDGCGNGTTDCLTEIALLDNTPPTPVCDLFNNISLNADGSAYAGPATFDDHSYDNCDVYQTVIKRMDEGAACGSCATPRYDFLDYLGEYNGHFYYMSKAPTTGPKSFAYANAIESHVATIETAGEGTWLHDQVSTYSNASYFIGYQGVNITNADSPTNSDFDAQSGGVMNYDNWATGEPDWTLGGSGDLYVNVQADGTWAAERESIANHYYIVEVEDPCVFSQQVEFCCADIGTEVQVRMRVFDAHGNFAECMVMVEVQDFKDPTVSNVPANRDLDCEVLASTDYLLGVASDHLLTYGTPTFSDNCDYSVDYDVDISSATDCGSFTIIRTWVATDTYGNSVSASQRLTVGELTPFNGNNINWPSDYDSQNCSNGVSPDELPIANAYPRYSNENGCSNVTSAYQDQVFNYTEIACSKILRTWTVIDWCQPDEEWVHVQVIKIFDSEAPSIESGCQNLTEVEGEMVGNCMIETWESGLGLALSDNCSNYNEITVWYDLDLNNDGTYEVTGVQSDNANGVYPYGTHAIKWYAIDDCGNQMDPCTMTFLIEGETDGPTAYCLTEVVTTIPVAGTAEIWAADFDAGSFGGNCNENDDLTFSFSSDTNNTVQMFDCGDLPAGVTDTIELQMWVTDSNGDQSYCTTYLILQDNHDNCTDGGASRASISGKVYTEDGEMVDDVMMSLMAGEADPMMTYMTDSGDYGFDNVPMYYNYEVNAFNNDNPLNGVSTLDIVLIQKHILGLTDLGSPYKLIAADANNSSSISAIDLIVIRKLILGLSTEFANNDSWRFVDEAFVFADVTSPWPFNESLYMNDLDQDMVDEDFIAVKIGDVNNTVITNYASNPVETRSAQKFEMGLNTIELANGNSQIELTATNDGNFIGTQFSISLEGAELMDVIPGALKLAENNFTIVNGELLVSFDKVDGVEVSANDVLFTMELSNAKQIALTETLSPEVYVDGNVGVETMSIELDSAAEAVEGEFSVYQNTPNPFSEETTIAFELPSSSVVNIQIFDNSGKVLFADSGNFNRGYNEFSINQSELETTGILYYQISTDTHIATRKMIVLK